MRWRVGLFAGACIFGAIASSRSSSASETVVYAYDALGRLVQVNVSGGPNNAIAVQTCFDRAGNRTVYSSGTSTSVTCPSPTPTPTPQPIAGPPPIVTVADDVTVPTCGARTVNVVANDSDPSNNPPLTVTAVSQGALGFVTIVGATSINYAGASTPGGDTITYTVKNAINMTATGTLNVTVQDRGGCN